MEAESHTTLQSLPAAELTPRQKRFLRVYANVGSIIQAARSAKITRETHYAWARASAEYRAAFSQAQEEATTLLEDEAFKRAVHGEKRAVRYKGRVVGYESTKSDAMMALLLKANKPEKYGEKMKLAHTGPNGEALLTLEGIASVLHQAEAQRLEAIKELEGAEDGARP